MSTVFRSLLRLVGLTSDPASPANGDVWWRTDTARAHVSDGSIGLPVTLGPPANVPVVRSSAWHTLPGHNASGSMVMPDGRLFALPVWTGRSATLTGVAVNVTTSLLAANIRMGLYASDGVLPTTLISDYGTVSAGTTGMRQITGLSTPLRPVLYYFVVARQGGIGVLSMTSRGIGDPIIANTSSVLDTVQNAYYTDSISGTLPATFGSIAGAINGPSASIQLT